MPGPYDPNNPGGPGRTYDNGMFSVGQNDWQREAGNMDRRTPGFTYGGLGEDYFKQLADQYGKRGSAYANQAQQFLGNNDPRRTAEENDALAQLKLAASGATPSVAEQQMQRGMQQSVRDASSMAAGARGGPGAWAAAQRMGAQQGAAAGQDIIGQQGMVRANEMAQARGAYADAATRQRAGDLSSIGLNYQTGLGLGGLGNQAEGQNIQAMLGMYGFGQNSAGRQQQGQQAYNQWLAQMASHSADQNFDQGNKIMGAGMSAAGAMAGAASDERVKEPVGDPGSKQDAIDLETNRRRAQAIGQGFQQAGAIMASDSRVKEPYAVSDERAKQRAFQKGMAWMASAGGNEQNAVGALSQIEDMQPIDRYGIAIRKAQMGDAEGARTYAAEALKGQPYSAKNPSGLNPQEMEALKALASGPVSTSAIEPAGARNASDQLLQKLGESQSVYQYKDPKFQAPGVQGQPAHLGVMAQDLEKTPMGDSLVQTDKEGVKRVNTLAAQGAALAALGRMHERVSDLEKRKEKR